MRHGTRKSHVALVRSLKTTLMQKGFDSDDIDQIVAAAVPAVDEEQETDLLVVAARKAWRQKHRYAGRERRMKVKQALVRKASSMTRLMPSWMTWRRMTTSSSRLITHSARNLVQFTLT
ncbi:RecX family transcriptional regulator [Lacticaseibacillus thailandensis]|uniref:RecX family transcriptional regulator n=1 Tax=Lacticaseibacillus thailandensis TaxID=381741 RepID=UPI00138F4461|nr:RecX family transcriptional regulator [Lacticaseibacillus thailandensis]